MPTTRSAARNAVAGPSSPPQERATNGVIDDKSGLSELSDTEVGETANNTSTRSSTRQRATDIDIEFHLTRTLSGVKSLKKQIKALQEKNAELQSEVNRLHEAEDVSIQPKRGRRGGLSPQALRARVRKLEGEIARLEKAREKDRKRIKKLKIREVDEDAAELQDEFAASGDMYEKMRKLLRRFDQIVSTPSFHEEEECMICSDKLENKNPISLPCEHILCNPCIHSLLEYHSQPGNPPPKCPTCRAPIAFDLEDAVAVTWSATQQWDALLEVAQEWARVDRGGGGDEDEGEESEEEKPFIVEEGEGESSTEASDDDETEPEPEPGSSRRVVRGRTHHRNVVASSEPNTADNHAPENQQDQPQDGSPSQHAHDDSTTAEANDTEHPAATPSNSRSPPRTPQTSRIQTPYLQSPSAEKRKRMELLAQSRKKRATDW